MIVTWTNIASDDIESIYEYIAADNKDAAAKVVLAIYNLGETLFSMAERGRKGSVDGTRELVMTTFPYTIVYQIKGDRVEVLRVIHQARLWPQMS